MSNEFPIVLFILGISLDPDNETPDIYFLMVDDSKGHNYPVTCEGYIIFFSDPVLASEALKLAEPGVRSLELPLVDSEQGFDVAQTLYLLQNGDFDQSRTILHCLNMLFDLVAATEWVVPSLYKGPLYKPS